MIAIVSCKKESAIQVVTTPQQDQEEKVIVKKIKVYLCTDAGALIYSHTYKFGIDYHTNVAAMDTFTDALWFAHHELSTGDTTLAYLYPYAIVNTNTASLYAYPTPELQADPNFADFKPWFQNLVKRWMGKHECTDCSDIVVGTGTSQFLTKISCSVNN